MVSEMTFETDVKKLLSLASRSPIVLVEGPRGCAKERIARLAFPKKNYIDLESRSMFELARKSPRTFLLAFPDGALINEAGRVPGMLEAVRYHVTRYGAQPGRYILTSSLDLHADDSDGRLAKMTLDGLSYPEMEAQKIPTHNPFKMIHSGQLRAVLSGEQTISQILRDAVKTDMKGHINSVNMELFRRFLFNCAAQSGGRLSMNQIAKGTGVSGPTVKTWVGLLSDHGILRLVGDRSKSAQYMYFVDTGVLCHLLEIESKEDLILSPYRDNVVRTFAFDELCKGRRSRRLAYELYGSEGFDLYARWKTRYRMVVDTNVDVTQEKLALAKSLSGGIGARTVILYLGDVTYSIGELDCISYKDWTKLAAEIDYFS